MIIRPEQSRDFPEIRELVRRAFESERHAEGDEQDFIERQRSPNTYLPDLALVLEDDGQLIAHIMLTRIFVSTPTGQCPILLLACVAVAAERRNQGLGAALIEAAFHRARDLGHAAVILVGDPAYYARLGFAPSAQFGITNENGFEREYVQIRELTPGALREVSGAIMLPS